MLNYVKKEIYEIRVSSQTVQHFELRRGGSCLLVFTTGAGSSLRWVATPSSTLIDIPDRPITIIYEPLVPAPSITMGSQYSFKNEPCPVHVYEDLNMWDLIGELPIGELIKGLATKTIVQYDGKRWRYNPNPGWIHYGVTPNDDYRLNKHLGKS